MKVVNASRGTVLQGDAATRSFHGRGSCLPAGTAARPFVLPVVVLLPAPRFHCAAQSERRRYNPRAPTRVDAHQPTLFHSRFRCRQKACVQRALLPEVWRKSGNTRGDYSTAARRGANDFEESRRTTGMHPRPVPPESGPWNRRFCCKAEFFNHQTTRRRGEGKTSRTG